MSFLSDLVSKYSLPAMHSPLAIPAFANSTNTQAHFCCISCVSAAIILCSLPTSLNFGGLIFLFFVVLWDG